MYVCVLIRVYLYECMHVYIYMCIYMCSIYMFMRRVCIHTRIPYFSELRFYAVYNIENRPFLGRGFNHAYIWMFCCVLYVIWNTYCFNVFYWTCVIRIVLLVFTWYVEYVFFACIFLSCFTYLCLVINDLINMFKRIVSYRIISYHLISYHIISYHIISYHIISYHIIYHIISYHIISYHIISYHIISYHIISYHHNTSTGTDAATLHFEISVSSSDT